MIKMQGMGIKLLSRVMFGQWKSIYRNKPITNISIS